MTGPEGPVYAYQVSCELTRSSFHALEHSMSIANTVSPAAMST
jgi:hypothetical protein